MTVITGSEDKRPTGPALDKRDLAGVNYVDDQRLGEKRLHEPTGVEKCRVVPAVENMQYYEKRHVIEDRADRPDKQNNTQDLAY